MIARDSVDVVSRFDQTEYESPPLFKPPKILVIN